MIYPIKVFVNFRNIYFDKCYWERNSKIKHKIKLIILLSLINVTVILSLSIILIKMNLFGVVGVGIGWIVGQGIISVIYLLFIKKLL